MLRKHGWTTYFSLVYFIFYFFSLRRLTRDGSVLAISKAIKTESTLGEESVETIEPDGVLSSIKQVIPSPTVCIVPLPPSFGLLNRL